MRPECGRGEPYNLKSGVYTFGLLCHEVYSMCKRYDDLDESKDAHDLLIFFLAARPRLPEHRPAAFCVPSCGKVPLVS
jgi:hypothetical protein